MSTGTSLLRGVRILDFSQYLPGPYATNMLASLGASVIKIEPLDGDPMRHIMVPAGEDISPLYREVNAGKSVYRVDLKSSEGLANVKRLASQADAMLDGFRPGVLDRLGLSKNTLHEQNPKLVICSLSGFGATGPYKHKAGHDINYCALAGLYSFHDGDHIPDIPFPLLADHVGGLQAVNAILAALVRAEKTGKGSVMDISLYETMFSWEYIDRLVGLRSLFTGGAAFYNMYRTLDNRLLTLGALEKKFWVRFCEALEKTDWIDQFGDEFPQIDLIADVREVISNRSARDWESILSQADCCFQLVPLPSELLNHPHSVSRNILNSDNMRYPGLINSENTPILKPFNEIAVDQNFNWYES